MGKRHLVQYLMHVLMILSILFNLFTPKAAEAKSDKKVIPVSGLVQSEIRPNLVYDRPTPRISYSHQSDDEQNTVNSNPIEEAVSAPASLSAKLTCHSVPAGVTCTDYGTYLDYEIDIDVTGLTGGTTAGNTTIGYYTRNMSSGYIGMTSNFVHCESSGYYQNTVSSAVAISTWDAGGYLYPSFVK